MGKSGAGLLAVGLLAPIMILVPVMAGGTDTPDDKPGGSGCDSGGSSVVSGKARLPVVGKATVESNYGMRTNPGNKYKGKRMLHAGIDIAEVTPTTIVAAMDGKVAAVYTDSIGTNIVKIDVGGNTDMQYMHLASFAPGLKVGQKVWQGKPLGIEGSTGNSTGPHLHFQIDVGGKSTDPRPWMKAHGVNIPQVGQTVEGPIAVPIPPVKKGSDAGPVIGVAAKTGSFTLPPPGEPRKDSLHRPAESIPSDWKQAYTGAAKKFGVPWTLLAGIGEEETQQGRNIATSWAGAKGPMQFTDPTWKDFGVDGDGDGTADIMNVSDAIYSAANMLVKSGVKSGADGVKKAIRRYNAADWYVNDVLYYAQAYGGGDVSSCDAPASTAYGKAAVAAAKAWMGLPYVYGGGTFGPPPGPTTGLNGSGGGLRREGFDCSGFSAAVVAEATSGRLKLPHLSTSQYTTSQLATVASYSGSGPRPLSKMQPGDVIIFNIPLSLGYDSHPWNHVGMYIGNGEMIDAAKPGTTVRVDNIETSWAYEWTARRPLAEYTRAGK